MEMLTNCTGLWDIYRHLIDGKSMIYRFPKGFARHGVDNFLRNHQLIKDLGLATLESVKEHTLDGNLILVTEDINYEQTRLYVSSNSVYGKKQQLVDKLSQPILQTDPGSKIMSPYERWRYEHQLWEITNFGEFIAYMKEVLVHVSQQRVSIDFDAYFFGTDRAETSTIDYKIVDMDHITRDEWRVDLHEINLSEFKRALDGFIRDFVVEHQRDQYLRQVELVLI